MFKQTKSQMWNLTWVQNFILYRQVLQYLEWPLNTRRRALELASNNFTWHSSPPTQIRLPSDLKLPPYAVSRKRLKFFWTTFVIGLYIWTWHKWKQWEPTSMGQNHQWILIKAHKFHFTYSFITHVKVCEQCSLSITVCNKKTQIFLHFWLHKHQPIPSLVKAP